MADSKLDKGAVRDGYDRWSEIYDHDANPAMFLRDVRARFHDPATGATVEPGSIEHTIGDCVMAAVRAGFVLEGIEERAPDADLAARLPRAERYVGWPMLVVLALRA